MAAMHPAHYGWQGQPFGAPVVDPALRSGRMPAQPPMGPPHPSQMPWNQQQQQLQQQHQQQHQQQQQNRPPLHSHAMFAQPTPPHVLNMGVRRAAAPVKEPLTG
eukprot:Opistho-2@39355